MSRIDFPAIFPTLRVNPREGESSLLFRSGEILKGTILEQVDAGHVLLRIKGQELLVETRQADIPLNQEVNLRVEEVQPQVILKIVPDEIPAGREVEFFLKKFLAADVPLEQLAEPLGALWKIPKGALPPQAQENLTQLLTFLMAGETSSGDWTRLQNILEQAGFFLETRLKHFIEGGAAAKGPLGQPDLKNLVRQLRAQLGILLAQGKGAGDADIAELVRTLDRLAEKIELYQLLNVPQYDIPEKFLFFLPLWIGQRLQFVEMSLSYTRKGSPEEAPGELSLLFLLSFPDWGRMRIAVQVQGHNLYGYFTVSRPEAKSILDEALPDLSSRLTRLGFTPRWQSFLESPEKIGTSLVPEMERWTESLLSIVV